MFCGLSRSAKLLKRYTSSSSSGDLELITVDPEGDDSNSSEKSGITGSRHHASAAVSEDEAAAEDDDVDEGRGLLEGRD